MSTLLASDWVVPGLDRAGFRMFPREPSDAPMVVNSFFELLAPRAISGSLLRGRRCA
jgi:hypothetical protein